MRNPGNGRISLIRGIRIILGQRIDLFQWLMRTRLVPDGPKFTLMKPCPFFYQTHRPVGQVSIKRFEGIDRNFRLASGIDGVKMRRGMITVVHVYDDTVELADPWHGHENTAYSGEDETGFRDSCMLSALARLSCRLVGTRVPD